MKLKFWQRDKPAWEAPEAAAPESEREAYRPPAPVLTPAIPAAGGPAVDLGPVLARLDRLEAAAKPLAEPTLTAADLAPLKEQIALLAARIDALDAPPPEARIAIAGVGSDAVARIRATLRG